jgi:hypothetical protein
LAVVLLLARRSSGEIFGFRGGDGTGGWSGKRFMARQVGALVAVVTWRRAG